MIIEAYIYHYIFTSTSSQTDGDTILTFLIASLTRYSFGVVQLGCVTSGFG